MIKRAMFIPDGGRYTLSSHSALVMAIQQISCILSGMGPLVYTYRITRSIILPSGQVSLRNRAYETNNLVSTVLQSMCVCVCVSVKCENKETQAKTSTSIG